MAKHYVFGYGSLICAESRAVTASALKGGAGCDAAAPAIPVRLRNWIRLWNVRGQKNTFLGVVQRFHPAGGKGSEEIDNNNTCVGVLVPLPSSNSDDCEVLFALDRREKCYDRHRVDLSDIERVDNVLLDADDVVVVDQNKQQRKQEEIEERYYTNTFLRRRPRPRPRQQLVDCDTNNDDNSNNNKQDEYNSNNENENENKEIYVWIYVPRKCYTSMASNTKHPILQSYVDIALRGCLSISKLFAKEFVDGTYGWYPGHQYNDDVLVSSSISSDANNTKHINDDNNNNNNNNNKDNKYCCWINDRHNPLYVRSDKEFSLKHSEMLDACLVLSSNDSKPTSLLSYRIDSRCDSK